MPLGGGLFDLAISTLNHYEILLLPRAMNRFGGFNMETECTFMLYKQGTKCILKKNGQGLKSGITGRSNGAAKYNYDLSNQFVKDYILWPMASMRSITTLPNA